MGYLFIFGNTPKLSRAELITQLGQIPRTTVHAEGPRWLLAAMEETRARGLFSRLGGSIKMGRQIGESDTVSGINDKIVADMTPTGTIFGVSSYSATISSSVLFELNKGIKEKLKHLGRKIRYILPRDDNSLSPVVVSKQKVNDYLIVSHEGKYLLGKTLEVSDFESWSQRDYGRPAVEPHVGMLPPRVARMMVNLSAIPPRGIILDPFCGVGTILTEALLLGFDVVGSDVSSEQVRRSQANLAWARGQFDLRGTFEIRVGDAAKISYALGQSRAIGIVTEPELGPSGRPTSDSDLSRLNELYSACLRNWRQILPPAGRVVMVVPSFVMPPKSSSQKFLVKKVIDIANLMGYSLFLEPIEYFRPQARVRRNILALQKH